MLSTVVVIVESVLESVFGVEGRILFLALEFDLLSKVVVIVESALEIFFSVEGRIDLFFF